MATELGSLYKNITETQLVKLGAGNVKGFVVNSHSSGTLKLLDGVDNTAGAKATSTLTTSGIVPAVHAVSVLTSNGTAPADGVEITIGDRVYTAKTTLSTGPTVADEVLIGASAAAFLDNLQAAINGEAGEGTTYSTGTVAHALVVVTANTDTTITVRSRTYGTDNNTLDTLDDSATLSWADSTLGGGTGASNPGVATTTATFVIDGQTYYFTTDLQEDVDGVEVANEILWVTSDAVALDNMKLAINGSGTEGTNYSTGTNAHPTVTATTNANTTQIIEAKVFGTLGNSITTTETMTTTAWTGTTLSGGTDAARTIMNTYTPATGSSVITFPDGINFTMGLYAIIAGTSADITLVYR